MAWQLTHGQIENGMFVCHHCDNPICVNPAHLFIGTQKDNMQDWTKKGKNRLANDKSLWGMGAHWKNNPEGKKKLSDQRKAEFSSGKRVVIRDAKGKINGTRMVRK